MKKYIVITGASSGIGAATARAFAQRGKNVILIARREEKLLEVKEQIQQACPEVDIVVHPFDLTQVAELEKLFQQLDSYFIEAWINNAGFGYYTMVEEQSIGRTSALLQLNVEALTILSMLYVQKYQQQPQTQLINISSAGGYTIVPTAVTYCASKFYVSSFTEGLALELRASNSPLQAKVLAPAATKTEFGKVANNTTTYNYDQAFSRYHDSEEMAQFLMQLYDSDSIVGSIDRETFTFVLSDHKFSYAGTSKNNQQLTKEK
ncbi:hypothetical protein DOK78_002835 [Enterococcus sp. DIV2402]|uniref:Oxidoreductase n=1 Tax=Candidatus Enterococcus lowellii TaxID=2230877 RepID=A0ABZ2SQY3_9ENTE|nr:SDR family NAD(P)-dependent oxidoreductase [Enterococcus sp. DIV2402]MBO0464918.1 SDR family NAD(P)-dependent oxidoreductase [Enterococcus sp. DIV2402]